MVVKCEVLCQGEQISTATFFAGGEIKGEIILYSDGVVEVQEIFLEISGTAKTSWQEKSFFKNVTYSAEDTFLSSLIYFYKGNDLGNKYKLEPGSTSYCFKYQIPENSPTSFEGRNGSIGYMLQFKLVSPWTSDQIFSFGFQVLQPTDLSLNYSQMLMPSSTTAYRSYCFGSCKSDPLEIKLSLPKTTYSPGNVIPVTVIVENNTFMSISELELSLVMSVRYFSIEPKRHSCIDRIVISREKTNSVLRNSSRSFSLSLTVPPTPPTCLGSNLIKILYNVTVETKMPAFQRGQTLTLPLTIRTEPVDNDFVVCHQPKKHFNRMPGSLNLAFVADEEADKKEIKSDKAT